MTDHDTNHTRHVDHRNMYLIHVAKLSCRGRRVTSSQSAQLFIDRKGKVMPTLPVDCSIYCKTVRAD